MTDTSFRPTLYLLDGCPFCMKALLFLSEAGRIADIDLRRFLPGSADEAAVRAELSPHFEKVTYPTVKVSPDGYINESDVIIDRFGDGVDRSSLPAYAFYTDSVMPAMLKLWKENHAMKAKLGEGA